MKHKFLLLAVLAASYSFSASASPIKPVSPLAGYKCLTLNATDAQMMDPNFSIPFRESPSDQAAVVAPATTLVPVNTAVQPVNGYYQTVNLARKTMWISAKWLQPYANVHPGRTCTPYVMTNGSVGFVFANQ
ncbi:hypothetical protein ABDK75_15240 [Gluconobacter sp. OJA]|uniref:hypothetical protein n=1 Tax=Gluconobacter TaxID=441 RepID=UPI0031F83035